MITTLFWAGFGKQATRKENLLLNIAVLQVTIGVKADITVRLAEK